MKRILLLLGWCAVFASLSRAQGGPPFITDDPGTVPVHHWEVNIGWMADHNPSHASYAVPNFDFNYGLAPRVQLKYEVPIAAATDEHNTTVAGLGESLLGIKLRPYEHHTAGEPRTDENMNFAIGTYPQVSLNNPSASVRRGVVDPGPQYYLPLEVVAKFGPLALNGEVGRWIGNRHIPDRWGRGLIAGHEFDDRLELYGELYDLSDVNSIDHEPLGREMTIGAGGRQVLDHSGHLRLLFMAGRSVHHVRSTNNEPNWIAYLGLQVQLGPKDAKE